ncbi:MAG: GIY-YIG nuclease family protein [Lunatimonas sp.]|uniref:GIY-YIG nuclease family protein n=1 Tax=Lunatimonas sp. TaxID=2060141 RepID=UPI00263A9E3F|nr:GIY-YIG nuclease family protein [Lunatimonas sp.]MCC5936039.1 GIY-YIG nuclease family protein [Lunatimonas sp.]
MYTVYILYSPKIDRFYIGSAEDMSNRLSHHNCGATPFTKRGAPEWKIVYLEPADSKSEARKRELQIKRMKSRKYLLKLIDQSQIQ